MSPSTTVIHRSHQSVLIDNGDGTLSKIAQGPLGELRTKRAARALALLSGMQGVPQVRRVDGKTLVMTELPIAKTLRECETGGVPPTYFQGLLSLVRECNRRGVCLVDMAARNLAFDKHGEPAIVDFDCALMKGDLFASALGPLVRDLQVIALRRKVERYSRQHVDIGRQVSWLAVVVYWLWRLIRRPRRLLCKSGCSMAVAGTDSENRATQAGVLMDVARESEPDRPDSALWTASDQRATVDSTPLLVKEYELAYDRHKSLADTRTKFVGFSFALGAGALGYVLQGSPSRYGSLLLAAAVWSLMTVYSYLNQKLRQSWFAFLLTEMKINNVLERCCPSSRVLFQLSLASDYQELHRPYMNRTAAERAFGFFLAGAASATYVWLVAHSATRFTASAGLRALFVAVSLCMLLVLLVVARCRHRTARKRFCELSSARETARRVASS